MEKKILAVDDDVRHLKSIQKILHLKGFAADIESNPKNVLNLLQLEKYSLFLLDVKMPGLNGIELFDLLKSKKPNIPIIMISGQSSIDIAVKMIKKGAYDFIEKPVDPNRLIIILNKAFEKQEIISERENLYQELENSHKIIGESESTQKLRKDISKIAPSNAKVLITGESGTGKELVAWALHHYSNRRGKPYVKLNCAAIPSELLESELFGHKKGSFTGAERDKMGKFLAADKGTLFLDEIGDMSQNLQAKLLRVVEENEVEVIGENTPRKIDVRITAANNKNVTNSNEDNGFRKDLLHRLNVVNIHIEPLRNRKDDIIPLAEYFLKIFTITYNKKILEISLDSKQNLLSFDYPGNVRELRNIIEKAVIFTNSDQLIIEGLGENSNLTMLTNLSFVENNSTLRTAKLQFEKELIEFELKNNDWNISQTARQLGIDRTNLFKKIQKYGIKKE